MELYVFIFNLNIWKKRDARPGLDFVGHGNILL